MKHKSEHSNRRCPTQNSLDTAQQMYATRVNSHSYCRTVFSGHRISSSDITPSAKNVRMNAIVTNVCTTISQPGTRYSRIT